MSNTTETIDLQEAIPLALTVVNAKTGKVIPGANISAVTWTLGNQIGNIAADPNNAGQWIFTPTKAGTTTIQASATITIS